MSQIKLLHSGGNGVILSAPDSNPASDRTLKLPSDGDGTILTTNSSVGKILQVANSTYNGQASLSLTSGYGNNDSNIYYVTQLDTTLTTTQTNSKILISGSISGEFNEVDHLFAFIISSTIAGTTAPVDALRGTTSNNRTKLSFMPTTNQHGSNASTPFTTPFSNIYYAPCQSSGTAITMRLGVVSTYYSSKTFYINSAAGTNNSDEYENLCSHMTLMEVAA